MQYGQRKLQRSMTDIRKSRNGRFARSFTVACVCQCATECVIEWFREHGVQPTWVRPSRIQERYLTALSAALGTRRRLDDPLRRALIMYGPVRPPRLRFHTLPRAGTIRCSRNLRELQLWIEHAPNPLASPAPVIT